MNNITVSRDKVEQWLEDLEYSDSDKNVIADIKQALAAPVQEPEIVQRVKRYAGQTMRTARNPNITARECIELANWIVTTSTPAEFVCSTRLCHYKALPDAMTSADIQEHIEYVAGWNDYRAAMMEMMK